MLFAAIIVMAGLTTTVMAQVTLTGNTAGATLVQVLTITNTTPLNFGVIGITAGTAGTVVMGTNGVRTPGAGTTTIINTGTQRTVALFSLTGTPEDTYSIGLPSTIGVTTTGAGDLTMDIDAIMISVDGASEEGTPYGGTHTLAAGTGLSSFLLAGTLNISTTQQIGVYAGTYNVTVDYN